MKLLALVGSGIKTISHITEEAKGYICNCDKVLYLVNEPLLEVYIGKLSKSCRSLAPIYFRSELRECAYKNIAQEIQLELDGVNSLCVVIYGHPCVFANLETNSVMLSMALTTLVLVWSTTSSHVPNFMFCKVCYQKYNPVYKHNVNTWRYIFCAICE